MNNAIIWHVNAWQDYLYWQENDKKILCKINNLVKAISRDPFTGIGKPEPLKYALDDCWSRRINQEHRLVYKIVDHESLYILQCRYHY